MTGTTTGQTSLPTATDSDDNENFLTVSLTAALQALANLFDSTTGHNHAGTGKGAPIAAAGLANNSVATANLQANAATQSAFAAATAGSTTTSATLVDVPGATVTITTVGGDVLIWFQLYATSSGANTTTVAILEDGVNVSFAASVVYPTTGALTPLSGFTKRSPAAGTHTYKLQWETSGGTATLSGSINSTILAEELKR